MSSAPPPPSDLLRDAMAELEPVKTRRPHREWVRGAVVSLAVGAGIALASGIRRDLGDLPRGWLAAFIAWWAVGFAGVLYLAFVPRRGAVSPRATLAGVLGICFGSVAVALGLAFATAAPSSTIVPEGTASFFRYGWPCYAIGVVTAIAPAALAFWYLRGTTPMRTRWLAAGIGAASGALGGLVLQLHCPIVNPSHLGLVHGFVPLLVAAVAGLAAGLLLRSRSRG